MYLIDHTRPTVPTGPAPDAEPIDGSEPTADEGFTVDVALRGRALRFVLLDELRRRETMTVAEMVTVLADHGYDLGGRASKGRIRIFAATCRAWLVASTRTPQQNDTQAQPQQHPSHPRWSQECRDPEHDDPAGAPWEHLGWLWTI